MKIKLKGLFLLAFIALAQTSCQSDNDNKNDDNNGNDIYNSASERDSGTDDDVAAGLAEKQDPMGGNMCFEQKTADVKTTLNLTINGNEVFGLMDIAPGKKEPLHGTVAGIRVGNTLAVTYNYMMEGTEAAEEKRFKLKGDKLWVMIGEMTEKDGVYRFKDPEKGEYRESLDKVECLLGAK